MSGRRGEDGITRCQRGGQSLTRCDERRRGCKGGVNAMREIRCWGKGRWARVGGDVMVLGMRNRKIRVCNKDEGRMVS